MSVTFWKEHLLMILLSDFVQSCMPTECFYVQKHTCGELYECIYVSDFIYVWISCRLWADCNANDSAVCVISLCWPLKPVHTIKTRVYNVTAVLLSFIVVGVSCESVNLVYLIDTFIWHDSVNWNMRIFDAGDINGSVNIFYCIFNKTLKNHIKVTCFLSLFNTLILVFVIYVYDVSVKA